MSWHYFPHIPEVGAHILVKYKNCPEGNFIELTIREWEGLEHIEKWCYFDDYEEVKKRKLLNPG